MSQTRLARRKAPLKDWSVNEALKETIDQIERGCSMPFARGGRKALDDYYRPHYEMQHCKVSWPAVRRKVLILARIVGHLASFGVLLKAHWAKQEMPRTVDKEALIEAATLISSSKLCPAGGLCPPCNARAECNAASSAALKKLLYGLAPQGIADQGARAKRRSVAR